MYGIVGLRGWVKFPREHMSLALNMTLKVGGGVQIQYQTLKQGRNYWIQLTHHQKTSNFTTFMRANLLNFNQMEKQDGIHMKLRILLKKFLLMF
ncbi:hypothetical protein D3C76_1127580 [compost metagenome]